MRLRRSSGRGGRIERTATTVAVATESQRRCAEFDLHGLSVTARRAAVAQALLPLGELNYKLQRLCLLERAHRRTPACAHFVLRLDWFLVRQRRVPVLRCAIVGRQPGRLSHAREDAQARLPVPLKEDGLRRWDP